jgi:hypothetical protein
MNDIVIPHRIVSQPQALYFSCEKSGLVLHNQPIPWNAEAVLVEALLKLPLAARRKVDFTLRLPGLPPIVAESIRKDESTDKYRLFFRLPVPPVSTKADLYWRHHRRGELELPVLTPDAFVRDLRIQMPTTFIHLGRQSVPAGAFVATQCKGMHSTAIVRSSTGLMPLLDSGLRVIFRSERPTRIEEVAVPLIASQLLGREALLSVLPPRTPKKIGEWTVSWMIGDRLLAGHRLRAISQKTFSSSLRISDTRFVVETLKQGIQICRQLPPLGEIRKAGPCFLVSSKEVGVAGLVHFDIVAQVPGAVQAPSVLQQSVLITDAPTPVAPGMLDVSELGQVTAFELRRHGKTIGTLALSPVPSATLTSEGGFKPPPEFLWSNVAEDELLDRLSRLMDVERNPKEEN